MLSRWRDADARKAIEGYAKVGVSERPGAAAPIVRACSAAIPLLVLHGGGNTLASRPSWPTCWARRTRCLCVKGSGWDMASIEPAGLPAVKLEPLRKLRRARSAAPTRTWLTSSA